MAPRLRRRAVFVDRDGTLNPDLHYLRDASRIELFRGVGSGIRLLNQRGFAVVCITNQSGVERGLYTDSEVLDMHRRIARLLEMYRAWIDSFYYCPHRPETGCACRKPGTMLFERAAEELGLELMASAIIGDRELDIEAGHRLGMVTAYVPEPGSLGERNLEPRPNAVPPDICAPSFFGAVARILDRG